MVIVVTVQVNLGSGSLDETEPLPTLAMQSQLGKQAVLFATKSKQAGSVILAFRCWRSWVMHSLTPGGAGQRRCGNGTKCTFVL